MTATDWIEAVADPLPDTIVLSPMELADIIATYARKVALRVEDARQRRTPEDVAAIFGRAWSADVVWIDRPAMTFRLSGCRTVYSVIWIDGGWEIHETEG